MTFHCSVFFVAVFVAADCHRKESLSPRPDKSKKQLFKFDYTKNTKWHSSSKLLVS